MGRRIIVKPALVVLVGAVLTGAVAAPSMRKWADAAPPTRIHGYLHAGRWKFETRGDTVATITSPAAAPGAKPLIDMETGATIQVTRAAEPDAATLSTGFNLAEMATPHDLQLHFGAKSDTSVPVVVMIADGDTVLWRQRFIIPERWTDYEIALGLSELSARKNQTLTFSMQFGEKPGSVELRRVQLFDDKPVTISGAEALPPTSETAEGSNRKTDDVVPGPKGREGGNGTLSPVDPSTGPTPLP